MRKTEEIAKRVVEAVLPGTEMKPNLTQSHGECDFNLHYTDGSVAAVEVTESADRFQKAISAEIRNKKKGGSILEAKKCKSSWMIFPMKNAQIPKIREHVDEYLSRLERAGREHFHFLDAFDSRLCRLTGVVVFPMPQCVENICYDLNIMSGSVISSRQEVPRIFLAHPVGGGAVGPSVAIEATEREACKRDNTRKLGAAATKERHLVVYVDVMNGLPWVTLTDFEPPSTLPKLAAEITHIWLIGYSGTSKDEFVLWRASTQEPWHRQRVVIPQNERKAS